MMSGPAVWKYELVKNSLSTSLWKNDELEKALL